jgi:primary-amine oxidase
MSALAPTSISDAAPGGDHALDPLAPGEIAAAVALAQADGRLSDAARFWGATLDEAHARAILAGNAPAGVRRIGLVAMEADGSAAWEITVALHAPGGTGVSGCESWDPVDSARPGITSEEARAAAQACRESAEFRAALAKRGIDDVARTVIDAESIGGFVPERYAGRRIAWGSVWHRATEDDNGYARPVQGVVPIIDLHEMRVLEVEDHGVVPVSEEAGPLDHGAWGQARPGLAPLEVVQPEGTSFAVEGRKVMWQGWELRVGFTHREGLVLYDLSFLGRSVLRRAACNEMYVPYLDPNSTQYARTSLTGASTAPGR